MSKAAPSAQSRLRAAIKVLRKAVNPHAFNCGYVKHPTLIKMIPVKPKRCTCGAEEFL